MKIDKTMKPEIIPNVLYKEAEGEGVLVNLNDDHYFSFNETGIAIWKLIDGKKTVEEIAQEICKNWDTGLTEALKDTIDFVKKLKRAGLLKGQGGKA